MVKMDRRAMSLLALGHVTDDINQSFVPAILPFLIVSLHLTYAVAAGLVLAQAISSSVIQPAIGYLADRRPMPWLISAGLLMAGGGVALMGIAPNYWSAFGAALLSGIGVACFHPEAARFANYVSGEKKATGMRWFAAGGNVGFALGPVFATTAIAAWGMRGTLAAVVPVLCLAALIQCETPRLRTFLPVRRKTGTRPDLADDWVSFGKLTGFVLVRSMTYLGLVTFLPLYSIAVLHTSPAAGAALASTYLVCGIAGTLVGGPLADRFGRKPVLLVSTLLASALVFVFAFVTHTGTAPPWSAFAFAGMTGFVLVASQAPMIVLGQEYLPNRLGIASGVTLGLAVSVGGMFTPVLGAIGDRYGLTPSLVAIAFVCFLAFGFGLTLPDRALRKPYATATLRR